MKKYSEMNKEELEKELKLNRRFMLFALIASAFLFFVSVWQKSTALLLISILLFVMDLFIWTNGLMLVILKKLED